jgi:hypothetical protein
MSQLIRGQGGHLALKIARRPFFGDFIWNNSGEVENVSANKNLNNNNWQQNQQH